MTGRRLGNDTAGSVCQLSDVGRNHLERFAAVCRQGGFFIKAERGDSGPDVAAIGIGAQIDRQGTDVVGGAPAEERILREDREIVVDSAIGRIKAVRIDNRDRDGSAAEPRGRINLRLIARVDGVVIAWRDFGQDVIAGSEPLEKIGSLCVGGGRGDDARLPGDREIQGRAGEVGVGVADRGAAIGIQINGAREIPNITGEKLATLDRLHQRGEATTCLRANTFTSAQTIVMHHLEETLESGLMYRVNSNDENFLGGTTRRLSFRWLSIH